MKIPNAKFVVASLLVVMIVAIVLTVSLQSTSPPTVDVVTFLQDVKSGSIKSIVENDGGQTATVKYVDSSIIPKEVRIPSGTSLTQLFEQSGIPLEKWPTIDVQGASAADRFAPALKFLLLAGVIGGLFLLLRRSQSGIGRRGQRRGDFDPIRPGDRTVLLSDVAGSEEVKEELADIIDFLREPERYHKLGARIPRGALLVGPPGTGKTLLARAVAGEAKASFFSVSGSEFVELYVGVGASRVRDLFRKAREAAPAIIFIDEIDSIGRKRGRAENSTEYDQTLNQILVEMDGFDQRTTVVVIAATNRADILDSALLRPGRFDRRIHVDLPDRAARTAILEVHGRGKPLATGVNLGELAARTTGLSGADLANVMNEAAILSARRDADTIAMDVLLEAVDRTIAGAARKSSRFTDHERRVIAYHEAGHALVAHYLPDADPVRKVSIVSRGRAGGYTMIVPDQDRGLWTRQQLTDRLAALLGGYAAEEIVFGDVTTGSSNDLEQISSITISMVSRYGMGQTFGLLSAGEDGARTGGFSQRTAFAAESEARAIVDAAHALALDILTEHRADLERLAITLLEVETVEGDQLEAMFGPAITASPDERRTPVPIHHLPDASDSSARPARKRGRRERIVALPAAFVASALSRRRKTATGS
ncbi:MAG: ATP-dependent zinc metalloprotease FtsH [Thermomicrobiales bacterium]